MICSTRTFDTRRSSAATHIALGDDADLLDVFCILNHRLWGRSLNHASLVRRVLPYLAAYTAKMFRSAFSQCCNESFWATYYSLVFGDCQVHRGGVILAEKPRSRHDVCAGHGQDRDD